MRSYACGWGRVNCDVFTILFLAASGPAATLVKNPLAEEVVDGIVGRRSSCAESARSEIRRRHEAGGEDPPRQYGGAETGSERKLSKILPQHRQPPRPARRSGGTCAGPALRGHHSASTPTKLRVRVAHHPPGSYDGSERDLQYALRCIGRQACPVHQGARRGRSCGHAREGVEHQVPHLLSAWAPHA